MIIKAEIISKTYSGEYEERLYDNESAWNSQNWTTIKFTNEDYYEWCGLFRGGSKDVAISEKANSILVLTSDYLFHLNIKNGDLIEIENQPIYRIITVAPNGEFILADYYNIVKLEKSITEKCKIKSPIKMDMIEFLNWNGKVLNLTCEEFMNWKRKPEMQLDSENWELKIKNGT